MHRDDLLNLHDETCAKARGIMEAKNNDYTGGKQATDALANFKSASALGLHPVTGLLLRAQDKLMRIRSFVADGSLRVTGETVTDACDDLLNYAILCKALLLEEMQEKVSKIQYGARLETPHDHDFLERPEEECKCGRRLVYHYSLGWCCEDCHL
jgi:hypothetical protein